MNEPFYKISASTQYMHTNGRLIYLAATVDSCVDGRMWFHVEDVQV